MIAAAEKATPVEEVTDRDIMEEVASRVDDCWADMPLARLRRAGEIGWDIDPDGPTGPEKFDNVYNKVRPLSSPHDPHGSAIPHLEALKWKSTLSQRDCSFIPTYSMLHTHLCKKSCPASRPVK